MVKRKCSSGLFFSLIAAIFTLTSCDTSGPHKPTAPSPALKGGPATSAEASYSDVKPIFESRCAKCHVWHSNEATAVDAAKRGVMSTMILDRKMPKDPKIAQEMTQSEREKIVAWAEGIKTSGDTAPTAMPPDVNTINNRQLAFVSRCMSCHGPRGTSLFPEVPNLASSGQPYLVKRLIEFMSPEAVGTMMPAQMQTLMKDFDLKDENDPATMELLNYAAAFFGTYALETSIETLEAERTALAPNQLALYESGKKLVQENQCIGCHLQADQRPMADMPMIFAQKISYLNSRFTEFKKGTGGETMPGLVEALTEDNLKAISLYLSLTHPSEHVQPE